MIQPNIGEWFPALVGGRVDTVESSSAVSTLRMGAPSRLGHFPKWVFGVNRRHRWLFQLICIHVLPMSFGQHVATKGDMKLAMRLQRYIPGPTIIQFLKI